MIAFKFSILLFFLFSFSICLHAQSVQDIEDMERTYKDCLKAKVDTSNCGKTFLHQMDSMLNVVYEKVRIQLSTPDVIVYMKEQQNWVKKKDTFFKKQDENFVYNLQEGIWLSSMIWLVYENKADFIKKRVVSLAKKLE